MSVAEHVTELSRLLHAWRAHLLEALGGAPEGFEEAVRAQARAYLQALGRDLEAERAAVEAALAMSTQEEAAAPCFDRLLLLGRATNPSSEAS